jgi:anti-anti-sigma factor
MAADVTHEDGIVVVRPHESIRVKQVIPLRTVLEEIAAGPLRPVAFDFASVVFVDSSGVGLLVNFAHRAMNRGASVCIFNVSHDTRELLDIAGVSEVVSVLGTREEMLEYVKGRADECSG